MATDPLSAPSSPRVLRSPWFKFITVAAITIAMAVPLLFIQFALSDREQTAAGAMQDIAAGWGGTQTLAGPVLLLPYTTTDQETVNGVGVDIDATHRHVAVLPEDLAVSLHQRRHAGAGHFPRCRCIARKS